MGRYILGVDNGTTGVKAKLYDLSGNVVSHGSSEYGCIYPCPGWVEQDVGMLTAATFAALATAVSTSGVDPREIVSVGVSTQRGLHLYVGENGQLLREGMGLSWQDARHHEQIEWMHSVIGDENFYRLTGLPISAFWPIGKIRWVQQNEPEVFARVRKVVTTQEWFLRELGARDGWFIDWSNASLCGLMDVERFEWSPELLAAVGLDRSQLPDIVPSGYQVGTVDRRCHELTGLAVGTPVCTGGGDQQCAAIGAGVIRRGLCELTFGTAGNAVAYLDAPVRDPHRIVTCSAHATPTQGWEAEGIQAAAGASYRWFRDHVGYLAKHLDASAQLDPYALINGLAARAPVGSDGLIFMPYLAGSMTPHYDSYAQGAFIGLTLKHDTGSMARAVLEGVAFEAKDVLDAYAHIDLDLQEIRLAGGATKSPLWCQIQADVYGRPTAVLREGECAVLGAALLGAVGAGVFNSVEEACDATVQKLRTFVPDAGAHRKYRELHAIFKDCYAALKQMYVYRRLNAFRTS
ncbi:MAG: xylulokinase [Janthinobacterium lividum]